MNAQTKVKNKLSPFAHFYVKNGNVCIYNALTMDTLYFEKKYLTKVKNLISDPDFDKNYDKNVKAIIKQMEELQLLVQEDYDVEKILESVKTDIFNGVNIRVMVLHLTDFCNLKCKYCFIEGGMCNNYIRNNMSKKVMKAAIDKYIQILDKGNMKANPSIVFYGGEPLANWEVLKYGLEYIDECQKSGKTAYNIDKVVITNGTLISEEIASVLKKYNVLVSLSLDGIKEVNDYNRIDYNNQGSFDRIIKGLTMLRNEGIEPSISSVMSPISIKYIDKTIKFLLGDLNIKGLGFNHVSIIPNLNYYDPKYEEQFADALLHVQELIQKEYSDVYERRMGHKINCFVDKLLLKADCTGCGEQMSISPTGEIGICQGYMGTRKTFNNNVFDKNYFPDEDPTFIEWSTRSPLNIKKCLGCPALATCGGGCPRNADMINGSIWKVDSAFCHFALKANEWLIWENFKDEGYCYEEQ